MSKIHIKCKHCNEVFEIEKPTKVGAYSAVCPNCEKEMTFKIFPQLHPAGKSIAPQKAITIKCPQCKTMFSAPLPSTPGGYGIVCPTCKREIRIKLNV